MQGSFLRFLPRRNPIQFFSGISNKGVGLKRAMGRSVWTVYDHLPTACLWYVALQSRLHPKMMPRPKMQQSAANGRCSPMRYAGIASVPFLRTGRGRRCQDVDRQVFMSRLCGLQYLLSEVKDPDKAIPYEPIDKQGHYPNMMQQYLCLQCPKQGSIRQRFEAKNKFYVGPQREPCWCWYQQATPFTRQSCRNSTTIAARVWDTLRCVSIR